MTLTRDASSLALEQAMAALDALSPEDRAAVVTLSRALGSQLDVAADADVASNELLVGFAERTFYVPETQRPILLLAHQKMVLNAMFDPKFARHFGVTTGFQTYVYSTIKKSGKTTIAALIARWIAETWGRFNEVYSIANDKEQSRGRVYAKALQSIELDPRYARDTRTIPGQWRIIERDATHLPSGSYLRAVSNDYKGEAGANPTGTFWSELWGYTLEASRRLWDELTPVPTRPRSIRFVETYAGFQNESTLLVELYRKCTEPDRGAQRVTREDLEAIGYDWPFGPDHDPQLPLYVNPALKSFAYWDFNPPNGTYPARRMPWQTDEYYIAQAMELRPEVFERLHDNRWVSSVSTFIPAQWWTSCRVHPSDGFDVTLDPREPIVLAADASVSGDCTALVAVSRQPINRDLTAVRGSHIWSPSAKHKMDYRAPDGLLETILWYCANRNVVEIAYDEYQLHDLMTGIRNDGLAWTRKFSQGDERLVSDFSLYVDIRDRKIVDAIPDPMAAALLTDHITAAGAKTPTGVDTKLRIVKQAEDRKIDGCVALSMANAECKRLMLR